MHSLSNPPIRHASRRRKVRNYAMITISVFAVILASLWLLRPALPVSAQEIASGNDFTRQVTVTGAAQVQAEPDRAHVTLGVETVAEQASTVLEDNNAQMQSLIDALVEAGIPEEDIQTQAVRLIPQYDQPQAATDSAAAEPAIPPPPGRETAGELTGYRAANSVQVTLMDDLSQLGSLIDTAVSSGANSVQGIRFEVTAPNDLLDQARQEAWADAQHKAEALAELAGSTLGSVLTVNENSIGVDPIPAVQESFDSAAISAVPIQPGTQPIRIDLYVSWELVD